MRDDRQTAGQRAARSLGMTVLLVTAVLAGALAVTTLGAEGVVWRRLAVAGGLAAASVAAVAMTADAADLWVRRRRMTPYSLKMTRSLVFVAMLVAAVLSVVGRATGFFLLMTPALLIYLFGVVRRREAPVRRPPRDGGAQRRQRRGGRRRT